MTGYAQRERNGGVYDGVDGLGYVSGEYLGSAYFFVAPVSGEPDLPEGALLGEDYLRVEHGRILVGREIRIVRMR